MLAATMVYCLSAPVGKADPFLRQAGPMVGHVSDSTAIVWLRVKLGAEVTAVASQGGTETSPSRIEDLSQGFHRIHFSGLQPETKTSVDIEITRDGVESESERVDFSTAPEPGSVGTVRIGFGSCSKVSQFGKAPIYKAVAEEQPDFFLFGGDNVYFIVGDGSDRHFGTTGRKGDWEFHETMLVRHLRTRVHPHLDKMHRTVPSYAVWDDHDYGPNNADSTFSMKEEATRAFKQVWANPGYGTGEIEGIFSSFRHGPVEVFLMDNRTHKYSHFEHDDVTRENGAIWGEAQLNWLLDGLKASTAPVKVIANGTQFLSMTSERSEGHYQEALQERERLLEFLESEQIGGVIFLTGDRHYSEVTRHEQSSGTLVLDFTSSPLEQNQKIRAHPTGHPTQEWSMRGNTFGLVTIDIPEEGSGTVRFEARDDDNNVPVIDDLPRATTWELDELNY